MNQIELSMILLASARSYKKNILAIVLLRTAAKAFIFTCIE